MRFMKKTTAWLLTALLLMSILPTSIMPAFAAEFPDFPTGWSREAMQAAVNNGLIQGKENGKIEPEANLTRAEAATIINRAFGSTIKADISSFGDVKPTDWFYDEMAKAVNMKTFVGDGANLYPNNSITREEMFTVIARALVLSDHTSGALGKFTDSSDVSAYAVPYLTALAANGYINGNPDGTLMPKANITREEFAQVMHNIFKTYISAPGTYTSVGADSVVIRTGGVTLKNVTIEKDLVLGDGVGAGDIKLENVTIKGRLLCRGGEGKVHLVKTTVGDRVVVYDVNGTVNFYNYRDEDPFKNIVENTPATFLEKKPTGGSTVSSKSYKYYNVEVYFQNDVIEEGGSTRPVKPEDPVQYGGKDTTYDKTIKEKKGEEISLSWADIDDLYKSNSDWSEIKKKYELDTTMSVLEGTNDGDLVLKVYLKKVVLVADGPGGKYYYFYGEKITNSTAFKDYIKDLIDAAGPGYNVIIRDSNGVIIDENYVMTDDVIFTVEIVAITYHITYDSKGGSAITDAQYTTFTVESEFTLPVPTKTGYTFVAWHKASDDSVITKITKGTIGDMSLYAEWLKDGADMLPYSVEVYLDERTSADATTPVYGSKKADYDKTVSAEEDVKVTLTWSEIVNLYNGEADWADIEAAYELDTANSDLEGTNDGSLVLKVYLKKKVFKVLNAETGVVYNYFYGQTLGSNTAFKDYYTTYNSTQKDSGYNVNWKDGNGNPVTLDYAVTADTTLKPEPEAITYTLTYVTNMEGYEIASKSFTVKDTITLEIPKVTGYNFMGWYFDSGFTGSPIKVIEEGTTSSITVYAKWTAWGEELLSMEASKSGDQVFVDVKLSDIPDDIIDLASLDITYTFDAAKLDYVTTEIKNAIGGTLNALAGSIVWTGSLTAIPADNVLFTIVFDVKDGAFEDAYFEFASTVLKDSTAQEATKYTTTGAYIYLGDPYYTVKLYIGVEKQVNLISKIENVPGGSKLDADEVYDKIGKPVDYAIEGYTNSDNEIHYIVPELMYNNNGTWEPFDFDNFVINSDLSLCMLSKKLRVSIDPERTFKGINLGEYLNIEIAYDSESSVGESTLDALTEAWKQLDTMLYVIESEKDIDVYEKLISKLSEKGITDETGAFIAKDISLKMADYLSAKQIEGKIYEYIEESINDESFRETIMDAIRNNNGMKDSIMNTIRNDATMQKTIMDAIKNDESMKNTIMDAIKNDDSMKNTIMDAIKNDEAMKDTIMDAIKNDDSMKETIMDAIKNDEGMKETIMDAIKNDDSMKDTIMDAIKNDEGMKDTIMDAIKNDDSMKDTIMDAIKNDASMKDTIMDAIKNDASMKDTIMDAIKNDDSMKDTIMDAIKNDAGMQSTIMDAIKNDAGMQSTIMDAIKNDDGMKNTIMDAIRDDANMQKTIMDAIRDDDGMKNTIMDAIRDDANIKAHIKTTVKDAISSDGELRTTIINVVKDMLNNDAAVKADIMTAVRDALATDATLKADVVATVKDMLNNDAAVKADIMDAVRDALTTDATLKADVVATVKDLIDTDAAVKADIMTAVKDALTTDAALKADVVATVKDLIDTDAAVKADIMTAVKDALATDAALKADVVATVKDLINTDAAVKADIMTAVKDALTTDAALKADVVATVKDLIDTDAAVKADVMASVEDALTTDAALKADVVATVKDLIDTDDSVKADVMTSVKDAFATDAALKADVVATVKDLIDTDDSVKADVVASVKDALATDSVLKDDIKDVVKDEAKDDIKEPVKEWILDNIEDDSDLRDTIIDYVTADDDIVLQALENEDHDLYEQVVNGNVDLDAPDVVSAIEDYLSDINNLKSLVEDNFDVIYDDHFEEMCDEMFDKFYTDDSIFAVAFDKFAEDNFETAFDKFIEDDANFETAFDKFAEDNFETAFDKFIEDDANFETAFDKFVEDNFETAFDKFIEDDANFETAFDKFAEDNFETAFDKFIEDDANFETAFDKFVEDNFETAFDKFIEDDANFETAFDKFVEDNFETAFDKFIEDDANFETAFDKFVEDNFETAFDKFIEDDANFETAFDKFVEDNFETAFDKFIEDDANFEKAFDKFIEDDANFKKAFDEFIEDEANFKETFDKFIEDDVNFKKAFDKFIENEANFKKAFDKFIEDDANFKKAFDKFIEDDANFEKAFDKFIADDVNFKKAFDKFVEDEANFEKAFDKFIEDEANFKKAFDKFVENEANFEKAFDKFIEDEANFKKAFDKFVENEANFRKAFDKFIEDEANFKKAFDKFVENEANFEKAFDKFIADEANFKKAFDKFVENEVNFKKAFDKFIENEENFKKAFDKFIADEANFKKTFDKFIEDDANFKKVFDKFIEDEANLRKAVDAFKETDAYKSIIKVFENKEDNFVINSENLLLARAIATAVESYTYEQIKTDFVDERLQKVLNIVGDDIFEKYVNEATSDFAKGLNEVCDKVDEDIDNGITDSVYTYPARLAIDIDVVSEIIYPAYNKAMAKVEAKIATIDGIRYNENPYFQKLVTTNYLDEFFFDKTTVGGKEEYRLKKDLSAISKSVLDTVILAHDAITWYNTLGADNVDAMASGAAAILATYANRLNSIIMNFIENGELPGDITLEQIFDINGRIEPAYNRVDQYAEKIYAKYEEYLDRDYNAVFEKLVSGKIVANGENFDSIDIVVETKVFDIDDAFDAVLGGNNFAGNKYVDKIVNKLNSTKYDPEETGALYYIDAYKATLDSKTFRGYTTGDISFKVERFLK